MTLHFNATCVRTDDLVHVLEHDIRIDKIEVAPKLQRMSRTSCESQKHRNETASCTLPKDALVPAKESCLWGTTQRALSHFVRMSLLSVECYTIPRAGWDLAGDKCRSYLQMRTSWPGRVSNMPGVCLLAETRSALLQRTISVSTKHVPRTAIHVSIQQMCEDICFIAQVVRPMPHKPAEDEHVQSPPSFPRTAYSWCLGDCSACVLVHARNAKRGAAQEEFDQHCGTVIAIR